MMELVDDDHVEMGGFQRREAARIEALDRGENVLETIGAITADPKFAERGVAKAVTEGADALREDLFSMGDEEQA